VASKSWLLLSCWTRAQQCLYRQVQKEAIGHLDEVAIAAIHDRINLLRVLDKRRKPILVSLAKRSRITDELKENILAAETMTVFEDDAIWHIGRSAAPEPS
jgi:hypothetical protein